MGGNNWQLFHIPVVRCCNNSHTLRHNNKKKKKISFLYPPSDDTPKRTRKVVEGFELNHFHCTVDGSI